MQNIKSFLIVFLLILGFNANADIIGACATPGPTYSVINNSVTFTTPSTVACLPNGISGASASSNWTLSGSTPTSLVIKVQYNLYRGTSISSGATFVGAFTSSTSYVPGTSISGSYTIANNMPMPSNLITLVGTYSYFIQASLVYVCPTGATIKGFSTAVQSTPKSLSLFNNNNQNTFNVNGITQTVSTAPGTIYILDPFNYQYSMSSIVTNGITSYQVRLEKGNWTSPNFTTTYTANSAVTNATSVPSTINLTSIFGADLVGYTSGYIRISLITKGNGSNSCNLTTTTFTKSQIFQVVDKTAGINYTMNRGNDATCNSTVPFNDKPIVTTLPLPALSPTIGFTTLCSVNGWQGAKSCGVSSITVPAGTAWTMKVYEVNPTTGIVLGGAPILVNVSGTGPRAVSQANPNSSTNILFNVKTTYSSNTVAPFYAVVNTTAKNYFQNLYTYANGNSTGFTLASYKAKVFCTELSVVTPQGTALKKGFFGIATDGVLNGGGATWKSIPSFNEEKKSELVVYPNPANEQITITGISINETAQLQLFDNLGRKVMTTNIKNEEQIDIKQLTKGLYFYTIHMGEEVFNGKIIKE